MSGWSWDPLADAWNQSFDAVRDFQAAYKRLPAWGAAGEEGVLATWVNNQRRAWKKGTLSPERVDRLTKMSGWSWDPLADAWNQSFDAVRDFRAAYKRLPAWDAAGEGGVLARWTNTQRQAWKKNKLSPERVKRLESLPGWIWSVRG